MYRTVAVSCSLGGSAPRPGTGTPGSGNGIMHPRRRFSATMADAPAQTKERDEVFLQFLETSKLEAQFRGEGQSGVATYEVIEELEELSWPAEMPSPDEDESQQQVKTRRRSSVGASTSGLNREGTSSSDHQVVPSTRTSRSKRAKGSRTPAGKFNRATSRLNSIDPTSEVDTQDEVTNDAAFLAKLRAWIRTNRSSKRARSMSSRTAGIGSTSVGTSTYSSFLSSLGNIPLLNGKQEQRLARIIGRGNDVRAAAASLAATRGKRPSLEEVAASAGLPSAQAAARAVVMAEDARGLMVEFNIRMVISISKRYTNKGLETSDLIPEGIIGLKKAIEKFDPSKGFKFSTYAHWWIRQAITRAISEQGRDVRLPVHVVETLMRLNKVKKELASQPDRVEPPSHEELAAAMGLPLNRLVALLRSTRVPKTVEEISVQRAGGGGAGGVKEMGRELPAADDIWVEEEDDFSGDPVDADERIEYMRETLTLLLSTLDTRERNIMRLRYGLHHTNSPVEMKRTLAALEEELLAEAAAIAAGNGTDPSTFHKIVDDVAIDFETGEMGLGLKATGALYDLSRERIRQLEQKAMKKLRSPWRLRLVERMREGEPLTKRDIDRLLQAASDTGALF